MHQFVERGDEAVQTGRIERAEGREGELEEGQPRGGVEQAEGGAQGGERGGRLRPGVLGDDGLLLVAGGLVAVEQQAVNEGQGGGRIAGGFAQPGGDGVEQELGVAEV